MDIELHYAISRQDLQTFYWFMWRRRLWMYHAVLIASGCLVSFLVYRDGEGNALMPLLVTVIGAIAFTIYPQLRYKPQQRELVISDRGLQTRIGKLSGSVPWPQVASIVDYKGYILIIRQNMNAFIVPPTAFASEHQRSAVLATLNTWREQFSQQ